MDRHGGGVAVCVHSSVHHNRRVDIPERGLEFVRKEAEPMGARPFLVIVWHRLPSALLTGIIENHAPMRTMKISNKSTPWLTTECKKLARIRDKLESTTVQNKSAIIIKSYKQLQNGVNNLNKKLKREHLSNIIACNKGNAKDNWKAVDLLLNKISKTTNIVSLEVEGQDVVDSNNITQSINKFFCSVGHKISTQYLVNPLSTQFRFETVTPVNVEKTKKK